MAEPPRVDFYIVERGGADRVACRLAEKAYAQGMSVFIRTGDAQRTRSLDELLWTFRGGSFVPHATRDLADEHTPVVLGEEHGGGEVTLLINLAGEPPARNTPCRRIAEIVGPGQDERRAGRSRFRHYRDNWGVEPVTHRLRD